jgi:hypothetical protein
MYITYVYMTASVVWWSEFLATDPELPGSVPGVPDFLTSGGSGTGSAQPHGKKKVAAPDWKSENTAVWIRHVNHVAPSIRTSWH